MSNLSACINEIIEKIFVALKVTNAYAQDFLTKFLVEDNIKKIIANVISEVTIYSYLSNKMFRSTIPRYWTRIFKISS